MTMLGESQQAVTEHTQWKKVRGSFDRDPRYKAVDSSSNREELFKEYIRSLKDKVSVSAS